MLGPGKIMKIGQVLVQAVLGTVGMSGREPVEKPPGGLRSTRTTGTSGRAGSERANRPKVKAKSTNCCAEHVGTSRPKGREGCEKVKWLQRGTRKPISGSSKEFVPDSPGQLGHKYTPDTESRRSREPIKSRHVSSVERGIRKPKS
ncbi:hypothetical protein KI387_009494, partial [Taxus chinensis]